jgi:pyruvate carboxylase
MLDPTDPHDLKYYVGMAKRWKRPDVLGLKDMAG